MFLSSLKQPLITWRYFSSMKTKLCPLINICMMSLSIAYSLIWLKFLVDGLILLERVNLVALDEKNHSPSVS